MNVDSNNLSARARSAAQSGNWPVVDSCARQILKNDPACAEGHFLMGLVAKAARRMTDAAKAFEMALSLDAARYDAAVELAGLQLSLQQHPQSHRLLEDHHKQLQNSPRYLDMAATIYSNLGLPEQAWPLYRRANELQPGVHSFQANLAACCVHLGRIDEAKTIYRALLTRYPAHQRHHFQLANLDKARDRTHLRQMQAILDAGKLPPEKNIFLYYAIGKELEDLEQWDEAFSYYKMAGDAVTRVADYDVTADEKLIASIIAVCTGDWLAPGNPAAPELSGKTPIFIIGLPRTGTTLCERILSSHSQVDSAGESHFMQLAIRRASAVNSPDGMNPSIIVAAARRDIGTIANSYLDQVNYRLGDKPFFVEKLPENVLYAGFIARAFPDARLVLLHRHPMDACFALYKQSYFKFAYSLDALARYYIAYDRLIRHWREVLGKRLVELSYEDLVTDQERQTRQLLDNLGLEFEQACLEFETNPAASATASSVQVRQKIHRKSIAKWRRFERQLQPLRKQLEAAGIEIA